MGRSSNSHAKKSDKETQSPVLKIFKEIMMREHDPEKTKLIKEKRKKKHSSSHSKSDPAATKKSCDSSGTEGRRECSQQYHSQHRPRSQCRTQSMPFQSEKRDSWWFWGECDDTNKKRDEERDTFSCVSCALKRFLNNDFACVSCLLFLFSVTAIVAFLILFKTIPMIAQSAEKEAKNDPAVAVLAKRLASGEYGPRKDRSAWLDSNPRSLGRLSGISDNGYGDVGIETNVVMEPDRFTTDLSSVLRNNRIDMAGSNDHMKEFYKKLIQVDARIRKLKKGYFENDIRSFTDRQKRSIFNRHKLNDKSNVTRVIETVDNTTKLSVAVNKTLPTKNSNARAKRDQKVHGLVIEKEKFYVQYLPEQKKVPKCSHTPKDSKSHENQLSHPFYKNTQRLDELLDQVMDKKLPEYILEPMPEELLRDPSCKHKQEGSKNKALTYENVEDNFMMVTPTVEDAGTFKNDLKMVLADEVVSTSTPSWIELSRMTFVNPMKSEPLKLSPEKASAKFPNRKLLQTDQTDEEPIGYEDLKEVLSDETGSHDEEEQAERNKREENEYANVPMDMPEKPVEASKPPYAGIHNPNWKGPMPLYPDEINTMIKSAAMQNMFKVEIPINTKDLTAERDLEVDASDVQYIEEYSNNKYDKLAKMAQAYSDYGVLDGKKDESIAKDKNQPVTEKFLDRRVKMEAGWKQSRFDKAALEENSNKEGFRIEFHRGNQPLGSLEENKHSDSTPLSKHLKLTHENKISDHGFHMTTLVPVNENSKMLYLNEKEDSQRSSPKNRPNDFTFSSIKFKRSLKSIDPEKEEDDSSLFEIYPEFKYTAASNGTKEIVRINGREDLGERVPLFNSTDTGYNEDNQAAGEMASFSTNTKENIDFDNVPIVRMNKHRKLTIKEKRRQRRTLDDPDLDKDDVKTRIKKYKVELHNIKAMEKINNSAAVLNKKFVREVTEGYGTDVVTIDTTVYVDDTNFNIVEADVLKANESIANGTEKNNELGDVNLTQVKEVNATIGPSDFFMMMSDFFSSLAGVSLHDNSTDPVHRIVNLFSKLPFDNGTSRANVTKDVSYPMYDSDMIDNIGHRSRVLLSIEEHSTVENRSSPTAASIEQQNATTTTSVATKEVTNQRDVKPEQENHTGARSIVKRNAVPDENLIFWNDIYDDEYGVQLDPLDNVVTRNKHTAPGEMIRKSSNWIKNKVKNITRKVKEESKNMIIRKLCCGKKNKAQSSEKSGVSAHPDYDDAVHKLVKRQNAEDLNSWTNELSKNSVFKNAEVKVDEFVKEKLFETTSTVSEVEMKKNFNELTEHMKDVCRQAADAVHRTRNLEVRQNKVEEDQSTGLMHQLVRLMSDLVDYQVQLKTCLKLPADLHEFLDWLTNPPTIDQNVMANYEKQKGNEDAGKIEGTEAIQPVQKSPESKIVDGQLYDVRGECLASLRSVQDLMKFYQGLSESDKSQMAGVKLYLEQQMSFLSKKLAAMEDIYNIPTNAFHNNLRYRRSNQNQPLIYRAIRPKEKWKLTKYLRNFGKKHTHTTVSHFDIVTDNFKKIPLSDNSLTSDSRVSRDNMVLRTDNDPHGPSKRNLKDIYYRAMAEAKKYTTVKNLHRK